MKFNESRQFEISCLVQALCGLQGAGARAVRLLIFRHPGATQFETQ